MNINVFKLSFRNMGMADRKKYDVVNPKVPEEYLSDPILSPVFELLIKPNDRGCFTCRSYDVAESGEIMFACCSLSGKDEMLRVDCYGWKQWQAKDDERGLSNRKPASVSVPRTRRTVTA
jgi:hypothetical protein